jgi:hypothetical protein
MNIFKPTTLTHKQTVKIAIEAAETVMDGHGKDFPVSLRSFGRSNRGRYKVSIVEFRLGSEAE